MPIWKPQESTFQAKLFIRMGSLVTMHDEKVHTAVLGPFQIDTFRLLALLRTYGPSLIRQI